MILGLTSFFFFFFLIQPQGDLNGHKGLVPSNFLQPFPETADEMGGGAAMDHHVVLDARRDLVSSKSCDSPKMFLTHQHRHHYSLYFFFLIWFIFIYCCRVEVLHAFGFQNCFFPSFPYFLHGPMQRYRRSVHKRKA